MDRTPKITASLSQHLQRLQYNEVTGSGNRPASVHFGDIFSDTVQFWKQWLDDLGINHMIAFALKATGQSRYLELCKESGISIDVASKKELEMSIHAGILPENIIANGPKNLPFIEYAVEVGCLIAVNSYSELLTIDSLVQQRYSSKKVSVICRIKTLGSRFGIDKGLFYTGTFWSKGLHENISIVGLSFHSDTTHHEDKKKSIGHIVALQQYLGEKGHMIQYLGIGGGYRVQYCKYHLSNQRSREYFQGKGLYGIDFLDELLHCDIDGQPFHEYVNESFTTLIIEPGRSLLDQSGILVHTIIDTYSDTITIDGNIYSTGAIAQEMPHDPLIFSYDHGLSIPTDTDMNHSVSVYGNLCLESDRIYSRKVILGCQPKVGDHLIFINTAGYFADFSNSMPIGHTDRKTLFL